MGLDFPKGASLTLFEVRLLFALECVSTLPGKFWYGGGTLILESLLSSNGLYPLKFVLFQTLSHPVIFSLHITSGIEIFIPISQMCKLVERRRDSGYLSIPQLGLEVG